MRLASTIDGVFPDNYAFYNKQGKSFRIEFASTDNEFSVVLFERTFEQNYENCFARGLFNDIVSLATAIDLWVNKQKDIIEIKNQFDKLELSEDFKFKNSNKDIDKAWTKVNNMFLMTLNFGNFQNGRAGT